MPVETRTQGATLYAIIDNPPVNALSCIERAGLIAAIEAAEQNDQIRTIVITGSGNTFIAGADIREFGEPRLPPELPDLIAKIDGCTKPVVAAINGPALGGGLEIALGCHFRVASHNAKFGLPEVTLGIVPGAGGTQRLPRLIDPQLAATMITTGKPISVSEALNCGLVDQLVEGDFDAGVRDFVAVLATVDLDERRISLRSAANSEEMVLAVEGMRDDVRRNARGAQVPIAALELVKTALVADFGSGLASERQTFLRLRQEPEAAALRYIFFAEREAAKLPADFAGAKALPVNTVGIVGAGTMGVGIAISLLGSGHAVNLVDANFEALDRGRNQIAHYFGEQVRKGRMTEAGRDEALSQIRGSSDFAALADCDLVIEAAFESPDVKCGIFKELGRVCKLDAVLATNTSYLDIDAIAAASGRPKSVVGMHYFSPAHVMKLLEIVRPKHASAQSLSTALSVAKRTGKQPVFAGVCNGFIGNRMLRAYTREAGLLLLEGATFEQIDNALTTFGMAMGPFAVADLSGIDIGYKARLSMPAESFEPLAVAVHDGLVERGALGRKTGAGFYLYEAGKQMRINPLAIEVLDRARAMADVPSRSISDSEIVERAVFALAAEGGTIMDEGVAARASDIDVVLVNGYGFPRWRGGPMFYAAECGSHTVSARISEWQQGPFGHWWHLSSFFDIS